MGVRMGHSAIQKEGRKDSRAARLRRGPEVWEEGFRDRNQGSGVRIQGARGRCESAGEGAEAACRNGDATDGVCGWVSGWVLGRDSCRDGRSAGREGVVAAEREGAEGVDRWARDSVGAGTAAAGECAAALKSEGSCDSGNSGNSGRSEVSGVAALGVDVPGLPGVRGVGAGGEILGKKLARRR